MTWLKEERSALQADKSTDPIENSFANDFIPLVS